MTDLKTAAQQALEALENESRSPRGDGYELSVCEMRETSQAITALRAALAQQAEPGQAGCETEADCTSQPWCRFKGECLRKQAEPVQKPVAKNPDPYHLSRILHELAGSASMCWEHVDRAGVFQSTQAAEVVAAAIAEIRQRMKDAPPQQAEPVEPVATLTAQRDALLSALRWIATVNAMDYEYQKVARAAIKAVEENT